MAETAAAAVMIFRTRFLPYRFVWLGKNRRIGCRHCAENARQFKPPCEPAL
jgi:hypothetical protein